jgi:hypothetical protein
LRGMRNRAEANTIGEPDVKPPVADRTYSGWRAARMAAGLLALCTLAVVLLVARWQVGQPGVERIDLGEPRTPASHFFGVETGEGKSFRWSRTLSAVSLPALGSSQAISVEVNPARSLSGGPVRFKLLLGTAVIGQFDALPGWHTYTATTGVGLAPDVRLLIESDTFYPAASDRRRLGMAVSAISTIGLPGWRGLRWPPGLWLLLAALAPILSSLAGATFGLLRAVVASATSIGLILLVTFLPAPNALPFAAWTVGLTAAALLAIGSWRLLGPGTRLTQRLGRIGGSRWELPLVALFTGLISLAMTWPLVLRFDTSLPGWPGDNFAFLYKFWWFRTALVVQHHWPFFDPNTFVPFGFNLGQGEPTLANTLPGVLVGSLFNDTTAYNFMVLLSFLVSGLGGYLLVRQITGSRAAGLLGCAAFAFCPYRMAQLAGHIQMLGTGWIAFTFFFAERALKTGRWQQGAFAGVALGFAALSAWYYAFMTALVLGLYLLVRLWTLRRTVSLARLVRSGLAALVALLVLSGPVALPSLALWAHGGLSHSEKAADEASASPLDYVIPNALHPLWGEPFMRAHAGQNIIEDLLYVGAVTVVITTAGFVLARRRRIIIDGAAARAWAAVLVASLVLSLGLTLHGLSGQVTVGGPIPLPGRLLFDWLPLFSSMRAYARFGLVAMLAMAVLMGIAWSVIMAVVGKRTNWLTLLALACLLADFWAAPYAWGTTRVAPTQAARFLASARPGAVMQMPLQSALSGPALYAAVTYGKPIAYGYDTFEPPEWRAARPALLNFPHDDCLDVLAGWGVRYLVVSANAYGSDWPGMLAFLGNLPRLRHMADFHEARVWDVDPGVLDARPDMEDALAPDTLAVFELLR